MRWSANSRSDLDVAEAAGCLDLDDRARLSSVPAKSGGPAPRDHALGSGAVGQVALCEAASPENPCVNLGDSDAFDFASAALKELLDQLGRRGDSTTCRAFRASSPSSRCSYPRIHDR